MEKKFKRIIKKNHRLFLCILPDKPIRDYARDVQRTISRYSYKLELINLEQIHLTLKFLGNNVTDSSRDLLIETLDENAKYLPRVEFETDKVDFGFFTQNKPNVVYISLKESPSLEKIVNGLQLIVKSLDRDDMIKKKDFAKFLSHITVARVKTDISKSTIHDINQKIVEFPTRNEKMVVKRIALIESVLTKKGPVYKIIKYFDLQGQ